MEIRIPSLLALAALALLVAAYTIAFHLAQRIALADFSPLPTYATLPQEQTQS